MGTSATPFQPDSGINCTSGPLGSPSYPSALYSYQVQPSSPRQRVGDMQAQQPFLPGQAVAVGGQETMEGNLSMGAMAAALPNYRTSPHGFGQAQSVQRFPSGISTTMIHHPQQQQMIQFAGQAGLNSPGSNTNFSPQYFSTYPTNPHGTMAPHPYLVQQHSPTHRAGLTSPFQQAYPNASPLHAQHSPNHQFMLYPQTYEQMTPVQHNLQG